MNSSQSEPWLDLGEPISKMSGNREGFEILRDAISALLDGQDSHVNILHDAVGIEELELLESQNLPDSDNDSCLASSTGCLILTSLASILILACFGLAHVWHLLFDK